MALTYSQPKLSLYAAVPLSALLIIYAILAFTGVPKSLNGPTLGVFSTFRTPDVREPHHMTRLKTNGYF